MAYVRPQLNLSQGSSALKAPHQHRDTAGTSGEAQGTPNSRISTSLAFRRAKSERAGSPKHCSQQYRLTKLPGFSSGTKIKTSTKISKNKGRTILKAETLRRHLLVHGENSNRPRWWDRLEMLGHHCWSEDNQKKINRGRHLSLNQKEQYKTKQPKIPG